MDHAEAIRHILDRLDNELPDHLYYHGLHHTLDVLEATERIASSIELSDNEFNLLMVAAAYHDCGFMYGHENHEERGCQVVKETLPQYGFDDASIEQICKMIMATKVPQNPTGTLSDVLCDADLDYLGRDDFKPIAKSLFNELKHLGVVKDEEAWNRIQLSFLSQHKYHTDYGRTLRQPEKEKHLKELASIVKQYDD